jgi:hypothetical protein
LEGVLPFLSLLLLLLLLLLAWQLLLLMLLLLLLLLRLLLRLMVVCRESRKVVVVFSWSQFYETVSAETDKILVYDYFLLLLFRAIKVKHCVQLLDIFYMRFYLLQKVTNLFRPKSSFVESIPACSAFLPAFE